MNLHVEAVCLSLLGSTQPARITEYVATAVKGGVGDDGMLQRFGLIVWPDVNGEWINVDRAPNHDALRSAHQTFDYLDTLDYRALRAVTAIMTATNMASHTCGSLPTHSNYSMIGVVRSNTSSAPLRYIPHSNRTSPSIGS